MILAIDVDYRDEYAVVAGLLFDGWQSCKPTAEYVVKVGDIAEYIPGSFYLRELPAIMKLLEEVKVPLSYIVVDGYVSLGEGKAGLGTKLYEVLETPVPVIGVAKSRFHGTPAECELLRGSSKNPLFVTAMGISLEKAKEHIAEMAGIYRLPTLLKQVDRLCRSVFLYPEK